jgi:hypothetical protein
MEAQESNDTADSQWGWEARGLLWMPLGYLGGGAVRKRTQRSPESHGGPFPNRGLSAISPEPFSNFIATRGTHWKPRFKSYLLCLGLYTRRTDERQLQLS